MDWGTPWLSIRTVLLSTERAKRARLGLGLPNPGGLLGLLWLLAIIDWSSPVKPGRKWVFTLTGSGVSL